MKHFKVRRMALLALAMVFLGLSWIWDRLIAFERLIVRVIPWTRFKCAMAALVDRLPAPVVLLIFLVPLLIVEPLLALATVAIAMGYVVSGAIAWIVLKVFGVGLIVAVFDLTQHRLMTMPWFARVYGKFMTFHQYAHRIVAPYKYAAAALMRQWRRRAALAMNRTPGIAQLAARFAARKRAANGRPPVPLGG
jgi:hypothetical protein